MRKTMRSLLSLILCLLLASPLVVYADPVEPQETAEEAAEETAEGAAEETAEEEARYITIASLEEFLEFAESCRLDSFSRGLNVVMMVDIDLTGTGFDGIPIFSGTFDGGGHRITGLSVTGEGSVKGLFRYLDRTAVVKNLTVEGAVMPDGSRCTVGGIVGSNSGLVQNCVFAGEVTGADYVGGIAGVNEVSGVIEDSRAEGVVHGSHFVGGVAGENWGVIRSCTNASEVNTTAEQNSVEISDITIDSLSGSESAATATDIGGITGANSGVLRDCRNDGNVGYRHIGYNIGGVAGSQVGYITGCSNYGEIYGRKEVGGIVGQMEPNALLQYEIDTLQTLEGQLTALDGLTGQVSANAQGSANELGSQIGAVETELEKARDAMELLLPEDPENPQMPDEDTLLAAQNALSSSLTAITGQMNSMASTAQSAVSSLSSGLQAITGQVEAIGGTIGNAASGLGGTITDVSDADTEADTTGKVELCVNYGPVQGDLNTGGIVGAASLENDFDPEDDLQITGNSSLNFDFEARAVVLRCENYGAVTAKKQNVGGIVGWMSMGLVRECLNNAMVDAEAAEYVGGIAGRSSGYIRACFANCALYGASSVGGIAGSGVIVTDCRSMAQFHGGSEQVGAILGIAEEAQDPEAEPIRGNYYLAVDNDPGGIDGVSYGGRAEPMEEDAFLSQEDLPDVFDVITVRFVFEDGSEETLTMAPGSRLTADQMPVIPEKDGYAAEWVGPGWLNFESVSFDAVFEAVYTELRSILESEEADETGKPLLLVQGVFAEDQTLALNEAPEAPAVGEKESVIAVQGFTLPESSAAMQLRYLLPEDAAEESLRILVRDSAGNWREEASSVNRSYLVFGVEAGDTAFALVRLSADRTLFYLLAGSGGALILLTAVILIAGRKKKKAKS